jgi:hypothetical protein
LRVFGDVIDAAAADELNNELKHAGGSIDLD